MLPNSSKSVLNNDNMLMMVKEKQDRYYDADGYRKRAACVCFRDKNETEILLVTSSRFKDKWIIPGGGVEPNEDPCLAAQREVFEEAGATGNLGRLLGVFENNVKKTRTSVFTFMVADLSDDWVDAKMLGRQRKWCNLEEAKERLQYNTTQLNYLSLLVEPQV